jgi:hypothetical protein
MQKPLRTVPFPNPPPEYYRRERITQALLLGQRPDPEDLAEEEAEALRHKLKLERTRQQKRAEVEKEFAPPVGQHPVLPRHFMQDSPTLGERKEGPVKETGPKPTWLDKFWKLAESNFFMGGGVAMATGGYGFILAGAPRFGFWLLGELSFLLFGSWWFNCALVQRITKARETYTIIGYQF